MGIRDRGLAPGGGCRGSGFSAATNCRCPPVEPIRSKSLETTASWPSAPHAEKEKTAAINQAQRLIIYPPAVALDADCERYRGVSAPVSLFSGDAHALAMRARYPPRVFEQGLALEERAPGQNLRSDGGASYAASALFAKSRMIFMNCGG